jgi:hypothetical protein
VEVEASTAVVVEASTAVVADFTEVAVEASMVAGLIVEAASIEARDLSEEEVLTEAEAFVAKRRRVITERAGV